MSVLNQILKLEAEVAKDVVGQENIIRNIIICLLCDSNLLLEGMPGLAKTRSVKSLANNLQGQFSRIQFTPDLLPADITGSEVYVSDAKTSDEMFQFRQGPIFGNLVLVDEINRAPPKVQSALLEAMEERQITVSGKSYLLPKLFLTMATQNPVEQEGTYSLPEAQLDRFLMKIQVDYPKKSSEKDIMRLVRRERIAKYAINVDARSDVVGEQVQQCTQETIFAAWNEISHVHSGDAIEDYIVSIVDVTRNPADYDPELAQWLGAGASPRATLGIDSASRANAWLDGRNYVTPTDVHAIIYNVLRHRLVLSFKAASKGIRVNDVIDRILSLVTPG
ncbi:MoxR family ATPase [uncultured Vibrio sp.]|uniref:AAA family ATPase n=1 Tax=uncultured Vibrio sp. TaxID=114054 RepID=UPI0025D65A6F|nr:MoxR family ATPase [uncultured Vibrio sp.]